MTISWTSLTCLVALPWALDAQSALASLGLQQMGLGTACCIVQDALGNTYAAGADTTGLTVAKFDRELRPVFRYTLPGAAMVGSIALDSQSSIVLVGTTFDPAHFPVQSPATTPPRTAARAGFVLKVNPQGISLVFSSLLGGGEGSETYATAVGLDSSGAIYVAGDTNSPGYPITSGAFQTSGPVPIPGAFGAQVYPLYAFLTKLTGTGDRILYSTFLGAGGARCSVGSSCIGAATYTETAALSVTTDGTVTIAGNTTASAFPVTPGALQSVCNCTGLNRPAGFVARFRPDGSALQWATFFGGGGPPGGLSGDTISALALAPDGGVLIAGTSTSGQLAVTSGVFQPHFQATRSSAGGVPGNAFVARINASGAALVFSTYIGGSNRENVGALRLDTDGHPWLVGRTFSSDFPLAPGSINLGGDFLVEFSHDASRLIQSARLPDHTGGASLAVSPAGAQALLGDWGTILLLPPGGPSTAVFGYANAAGSTVFSPVAPGEIVSLYGIGLSSSPGTSADPDSSGRFPTELAGTTVTIDGIPAPLLYASDNQINLVVPFEANGATTTVLVRTADGRTVTFSPNIVAADPQIFLFGQARSLAALTPDGTPNSPSNPAPRGSILSVWVNGCGILQPPIPDGSIARSPLPATAAPIVVFVDQYPAEALYAGAAPGLVAGIVQVNFRIPDTVRSAGTHTIQIQVGTAFSPMAQIFTF